MVKFFLSAVTVLACSTFAGAQQCTNGNCSLPSRPRAVHVIPHETGLPVLVCPPKINSTNCPCVSTLGVCPCVTAPKMVTPRPVVASAVHTGDYHTHTCSHGHTWNHTQDGGTHRCPYRDPVTGAICGEYQNRVDSSPRAVNTGGFLPHGWETHTGSPSLGVSSGGCANGSCSAPSSGQSSTRWYPGKRLGR